MTQPGWYPDPEGRLGKVRYWDGQSWVGEPAAADAGASQRVSEPGKRWLWIGLVVVVVIAAAWGIWGVRNLPTDDPTPARPSESVWNELPTSMSPSPLPSVSQGGQLVDCPRVENVRTSEPQSNDRVDGGSLSIQIPDGWGSGDGLSVMLTDEASAFKRYDDSSWGSFVSVGLAPSSSEAQDLELLATQVLECHFSSGRFSGYVEHTVLVSEAYSVDGSPGWRIQASASSTSLPGGVATFDIVVVDTANPEGFGVFWAGVIDADAQALADEQTVMEGLRLSE